MSANAKITTAENKTIVLEAFDTLFNKKDYAAAAKFWSENYLQHSAHIPPGREGLFELVRALPAALRYESGLIVAEGDYVIAHGRYTGNGQSHALVTIDIVRMENGRLAEHWDVWQDEATQAESKSGLPMFGARFPTRSRRARRRPARLSCRGKQKSDLAVAFSFESLAEAVGFEPTIQV